MKFQELAVLLPCHSLEDFPQHYEGDDAHGLLSGWTALWHPALLAAADSAPTWYRVDDPPEDVANRLIVIPGVSSGELPTGYAQRAAEAGACLIRRQQDRQLIIEQALAELDEPIAVASAEIVADFLALGYCFLQIQLLTRQMRYSSNLDEVHFFDQLLAGAKAATEGQDDLAREKLTACFDLLGEERDHYYSVDAYLLDLTLVAANTLGASLRAELAADVPINLLLSGELLAELASQEPETLAVLRRAVDQDRVGVVGGEVGEPRVPLLDCESILGELRRGSARYEELLGRALEVYGRRRFGLTATLPQILDKLGFQGALHATLEEGRFPQGTQVKTRWEGTDGSAIDAIAKIPLDASKPETFLGLASKLGESMDMDHVATLCLAHWPGRASPWYEDLRRGARYGVALGKFVTVSEYFRDTYMPGHLERFESDQYQSPYLKQSVAGRQQDPISSVVRYWQQRAQADTTGSLNTLAAVITGEAGGDSCDFAAPLDADGEPSVAAEVAEQLDQARDTAAWRFAQAIPRQDAAERVGYLIANPCSFARRVCIETPELERLPDTGDAVYAVSTTGKRVVVDIPSLGFAWVSAGNGVAQRRRKQAPPLAEDLRGRDGAVRVRNEFFEAVINPATGALQSLKDYHSRGNRLSQQLALRLPAPRQSPGESWRDPDESAEYSVMAADKVEVTQSNGVLGEVEATGRLLNKAGELLANYRQVFQAVRGSRVLRLELELEPHVEPGSDPWNSYYACRFAWADETAELRRTVHQTRQPASRRRLEAPQYLEIDTAGTRTAILTGGLPYHRRVGFRMLDSLLIVRGERQRKFRMAVGVDLANPIQEATSLIAPPVFVRQTAAPPTPATSGWLFHIDSRSVLATHWEPLVEDDQIVGFSTRLLETTGRAGRAKLSCFRPIGSARRVDFRGQSIADCQVEDGKILLDMTAYEWTEVEARWE